MGFCSGINDERPFASPMLFLDERCDTLDIASGVAPSERHPKKIIETTRGKFGIVNDDHHRKVKPKVSHVDLARKLGRFPLCRLEMGIESIEQSL